MIAFGQFLEVLLGGLMSGVLYSLVALGFVLIFKASGVFNFAQGAMVFLAGLALVRALDLLMASGFPFWAAIVLGIALEHHDVPAGAAQEMRGEQPAERAADHQRATRGHALVGRRRLTERNRIRSARLIAAPDIRQSLLLRQS